MELPIPVIDLFAGPGGLGEGFSALGDTTGERKFKIALSIEKEELAHRTLELRAFFREFPINGAPPEYYQFIRGEITREALFKKYEQEAAAAKLEAWHAQLGEDEYAVSNAEVDKRIDAALKGSKNWLLIGGPPCQAYSVVGRSRRQETVLNEEKDKRVGLYKQYLRILAYHNPSVFVMENVKGLLSAETNESPVFARILNDLKDPVSAYLADHRRNGRPLVCPGYKIYSLVVKPKSFDFEGNPVYGHKDFVIKAENYGIPQARHRVILLGVRNDVDFIPDTLTASDEVAISKVLSGLPKLRSGLSKTDNDNDTWKNTVKQILKRGVLTGVDQETREEISRQLSQVCAPRTGTGAEFISTEAETEYRADWYLDKNIKGVCNHSSRGHMESDLHRYFFVACFAKANKVSPKLEDFPSALLPAHQNVNEGIEDKKFADRFRVQLWNKPAKTITSHISKDGHYYIHPDPKQCRSFTVREAARIQTFPDNYYFCGPRTAQYIQVGNAVPPLLANQIAEIVYKAFNSVSDERSRKHSKRFAHV
jgi:DNA (cytosine-5)-methyltransferase 1